MFRILRDCGLPFFLVTIILFPNQGLSRTLTIIHTNDLHSHMLGYGPNIDYTPQTSRDDETIGGWARISTLIKETRSSRDGLVLVLDAGDFMMGTLFHTVSREEGGELRIMGAMGYDAVTLGNHEFDLKPDGLAKIMRTAASRGRIPAIVAANIVFDHEDPRDDSLEAAFMEIGIRPYNIFEKEGLKVGVFGILGRGAAEVAPFARPLQFRDPVKASSDVVKKLKEKEKVDLVICLSHSGLENERKGEDLELARKVKGIDIIVSGHSHTHFPYPIREGNTLIVQAGFNGQYVGVLDLNIDKGVKELIQYRLIPVDDRISGDQAIQDHIERLRMKVDEDFLKPRGLSFYEPLAKLSFPLTPESWKESNLGDFVTDAIRWSIDRLQNPGGDPDRITHVAFESNGLIRDPLLLGTRGILFLCDLFRAFPMGFGPDGKMGYPLLAVYLKAQEIRKTLEVLTTIAPIKGDDYFLQVSGIRFRYNPARVPFDRVVEIWIQDEKGQFLPLDTSPKNSRLYKVGANIYNATFLKMIGQFTHGILQIIPKDKNGIPIPDLNNALVDREPSIPGVQELKEWEAIVAYASHFIDRDGDGLPDIPEIYRSPQGRIISKSTLNPIELLKNASWITWSALGAIVLIVIFIPYAFLAILRIIRRKREE
jgi:5'-nucleotidase/UDP-sugar diphosphatase